MAKALPYEKIVTVTVCLVYFCYGIASSLINTTIIDLSELLETDVASISYGLLMRAVFHCIGAPLFAWTFTIFNREAQYALSLALFGIGTCFTASSTNMTMFIIFNALAGLSSSGIDIASYVWLLEIWKEKSNPYLQAMGGFWAIGQTLAPLINQPYLSTDLSTNQTINNNTMVTVLTKHSKTRIQIPFNIMGIVMIAVGLVVLAVGCKRDCCNGKANSKGKQQQQQRSITGKNDAISIVQGGHDPPTSSASITMELSKSTTSNRVKRENSHLIPKMLPRSYYLVLIVLAALMINFQVGLDLNFFNFLHTYSVQGPIHLSKSDGSYLVSLTSLVQVASRFIAIFISIWVRPNGIITFSLVATFVGTIVLMIWDSSVAGLWAGALIMSIGFAPIGSSIYTFLEERIDVTNTIGGILSFSSTILSTLGPYIVGNSLASHPLVFIIYNIVCIVIVMLIHGLLNLTDLWKRRYLGKQTTQTMITTTTNNANNNVKSNGRNGVMKN